MYKIIIPCATLFLIVNMLCAPCAYSEKLDKTAFGYESKGKRDPFVPLIGQVQAKKISGLIDITSIEDVKLEGIAIDSSGNNIAILNGQMVKEDSKFGVLHIKKISQKTVQLSIEGTDYTLKIQKGEEENKIGK